MIHAMSPVNLTAAQSTARACLLGGALGDAYGWPWEFITAQFSDDGFPSLGHVTDDTQMTLFSAEALLVHRLHGVPLERCARRSYGRWLATQRIADAGQPAPNVGWLAGHERLWRERGPGNTCLRGLRDGAPVMGSKGCGTTMRVAPAALCGLEDPFTAACQLSIITHGHPTGVLAGGATAWLIAALAGGHRLHRAAPALLERICEHPDGEETAAALQMALTFAELGDTSPRALELLGGGWTAESCLAIGILCALVHGGAFEAAVRAAALHPGDSDSTAAITGQLVATERGLECLPAAWLDRLELRAVIEQVADDLGAADDDQLADPDVRWPSSLAG